MNSEIVIAIVGAVFASSGLWGLLQYLISRKDNTAEKLDKLTELVKEVSDRVDTSNATNARTRILRFDDELMNGLRHSKEYFQQILQEIDLYEGYCEKHPNYKNSACSLAVEHIRHTYAKLLEERAFIQ